jgi:hypothetical protein
VRGQNNELISLKDGQIRSLEHIGKSSTPRQRLLRGICRTTKNKRGMSRNCPVPNRKLKSDFLVTPNFWTDLAPRVSFSLGVCTQITKESEIRVPTKNRG